MKVFFRFTAILLGIVFVSGCAIVGSLFGPRVLEKSKEQTPQWVSAKPSQLIVADTGFRYHGVRLDELDLPLGVKKAQLSATNLSEMAIIDVARGEVESVCGIRPAVSGGKSEARLDVVISGAIKKEFGAAVRVADIYYEKVESPESGDEAIVRAGAVYNIHVLMEFPREQFTAALRAAGAALSRDSAVESRRCGKALAAKFRPAPKPAKASR